MLKIEIEIDDINYDKLAEKLPMGAGAAKMALSIVPDDKKDAAAANLINEAKVPIIKALQGKLKEEELEMLILSMKATAE